MSNALFWLNDEAWSIIEPMLPRNRPSARRVDDRRVLSGIFHVLKVGCPWRNCPPEYGPYTSIYNRFNRWSRRRIWKTMLDALTAAGHLGGTVAVDSTYVKAHRSAAGAPKKRRKIKRLGSPEVGAAPRSMPRPISSAGPSTSS